MDINQRVKELRNYLDINRTAFSAITNIKIKTLENVENEKQQINGEYLEKLFLKYPEYAYWISTGKTIPEAGQISPDEGNNVIRMENPLEKFLNWVRIRQDKEDYFLALARDLDEGEFAPFRIEARRRYSSRRLTAGLGKTRRQAQPRVKRRV